MAKIKVLQELLANPKEVITLGYQALVRKRLVVDYEKQVADKFKIKRLPTINLLDLEPGLKDTIDVYSFLPNTSTIPDILLLRLLARKFKNCEYLEIGSFRGESLAAVSEVAAHCTSITLSKDELKAFGFSDEEIKVHGIFSDSLPNLTSIYHNSLTFDFDAHKKKYDLLFVDGDHVYESVVKDTQNIFKLLKDENSIIVWHDYGFDPVAVRYEVFAAILEGTPEQYRKNLYHVSNTMCAVFMRGKFDTSFLVSQPYPDKVFKVAVDAKKL